MGHPERFTEQHEEGKREEVDRGDQEENRRNQKGGESNLASNLFPMCSPQSGTPREVHRVTQRREEKRRGRREIEVTMRR